MPSKTKRIISTPDKSPLARDNVPRCGISGAVSAGLDVDDDGLKARMGNHLEPPIYFKSGMRVVVSNALGMGPCSALFALNGQRQ